MNACPPTAETEVDPGKESASVSVCPFNDLPSAAHHYIHVLESRIQKLETEQKRFTDALLNAGKFIFESPASKMMLMALPKEAQQKLREFFGGNGNR